MLKWARDNGLTIILLTPAEFDALPDGTVLTSISGQKKTKGVDYIDGDTRNGHLAYGRLASEMPVGGG